MVRTFIRSIQWETVAVSFMFVLTAIGIVVVILSEVHLGCSPGPKPLDWTQAQYNSYAASVCNGAP